MLQDVLEIPITKCYTQDATKTQQVQNELSSTISDDMHLACSIERSQSRQRHGFSLFIEIKILTDLASQNSFYTTNDS